MYDHKLDTFVKVAECGSFSKAAKILFVSSTAVIQQINLLEESYGFRLFSRTHSGVSLTPAGHTLYEDAKVMIRSSENSLHRARLFAESAENTVRIGTSVIYKCRMLPDIISRVAQLCPELRFKICSRDDTPMKEDDFGTSYDVIEGGFCSILWKDKYNFLELSRTPVCCAVPPHHHLAPKTALTLQDLDGERLLMILRGASTEVDALRDDLQESCPRAQILDCPGYEASTFIQCEVDSLILITASYFADIHTNLVTLPLETSRTLPYGLIYSKNPTPAAQKFIRQIQNLPRNQ